MTDADALLDAIEANPRDDTPRLVFADWLEENGHPEYADFIRLSCRIARREPMGREAWTRLRKDRHQAYEAMFRASPTLLEWRGHHTVHRVDFDGRGIPVPEFLVTADEFVSLSAGWGPLFRPRRLTLWVATGYEAAVPHAPRMARVEGLTVYGKHLGMRYDDRWRELDEYEPVSVDLLGGLADGRPAPRLTALEVESLRATASDLAAFAGSPLAMRLHRLRLVVRLTDNTRAELRTDGPGEVRAAIDRFLVEHRFRLPE